MNESTPCEAVRLELPGLVYGEASTQERKRLEAHLAHCAACRVERDDLVLARGALDAWTAPAELARPQATLPARAPRSRLPWLALAASLVALLALALGTEVRFANGQVVVAIGRVPAQAPGASPGEQLEALVRRELDLRSGALDNENARWRANLLQAIDGARAEDRRLMTTLYENARLAGAAQAQRAERALVGLADRIAYTPR